MAAVVRRHHRLGVTMELSISRLAKTYSEGVQALRDVSLQVEPGMFGLLGPNGAGKTTLMRIVATLLTPDSGSATFDGIDVLREKTAVRRRLGYLPQEFGFDPRLTAEELLDHMAVLKGIWSRVERCAQVSAALEKTHLGGVRRRRAGTFSGGMKQRLGVAQALLGAPDLVIIDEPTAGLDPDERRHLLDVLSELGHDVVVVLSTHIVEDVAETCQALAILNGGRVILTGRPDELTGALAGQVWEREADAPAVGVTSTCAVELAWRRHAGRRFLRVLSAQAPGPGFQQVSPRLEDVYGAALRTPAA
jgi:ABC-2 type transport system ATP-binding protein